jgi:hypothetical protein
VILSNGSSKTLQKTFCKKVVLKSLYKQFDQKSRTDFFSNCFYHVFGRFSKINLDPIPFSYSDPPTHHGGHRFVFGAGPLVPPPPPPGPGGFGFG